jgi:hypothetical protein
MITAFVIAEGMILNPKEHVSFEMIKIHETNEADTIEKKMNMISTTLALTNSNCS